MPRPHPAVVHVLATLVIAVLAGASVALLFQPDAGPLATSPPPTSERPSRAEPVPPPGQAEIAGRAVSLTAEGAVSDPLPLPLTVSVTPGSGGATIRGATVDGEEAVIVWDGGRPLTLEGAGIDLGPATVTVDASGAATWHMDGAPRALLPGTYTVRAPVAVGSRGLSESRDRVTFAAGEQTTIETSGGVTVTRPPAPLRLEGPGRLVMAGDLLVRRAGGERPASSIELVSGPFVVVVRPEAEALDIQATVRGPLLTR